MTRTDNVKRNIFFNILKFATQLVLQFVVRTILIYSMGAEYIGLNGLFTNIFSFLNLAELGIGSAIVFSMYKPIAEGDIEKITALQNLYKKFYLVVSGIVMAVGLIITPFLPNLIKGDVTVSINIYILYLMYLINTLVGYFSAHKRSLLFAYQRNDIENKCRTICLFGMSILQIIILLSTKNYYFYFSVNIIFTILECILIHISANKYFPEINGKSNKLDSEVKKEISKNVIALSMHKVGGIIVSSTDNIIISAVIGVIVLGAYSNYHMIISSLLAVFALFVNAITGSVGNLVASSSKEYAYEKYKQINFFFSFLSAFTTICLLVLFQPFMKIWTGGGEYLLDFSTVIILCLSFYFSRMRSGTSIFKDVAGIFWQDRWKPIAEALVNLIVSIILVYIIGINGVFVGTIISTLVAPFWVEPYVLYKHYFKRSVKDYFKRYIVDFIIMLVCGVLTYFVCSFIPDLGIWWLILKFMVCMLLSAGLLIIAYMPSKEFKQLFNIGIVFLKKYSKKNKSS